MRRVVVTGMGMITALGCGVNDNWKNLISGKSGIKKIDSFTTEDLPSQIGGIIPENKSHLVIDRPESVNLVKPPIIIIKATRKVINNNHKDT